MSLLVGTLAPHLAIGWPWSAKAPPPPPPPVLLGGYLPLLFSAALCCALPFLCFAFLGPPKKDSPSKDKVGSTAPPRPRPPAPAP